MTNVSFVQTKYPAIAITVNTWPLSKFLNGAPAGLIQNPFRPDFRLFAIRSYKALTIFFLSSLVLVLCWLKSGQDLAALIRTAAFSGIGCIILSILISREWSLRPAGRSFGVRAAKVSLNGAVAHIGSLLVGLLGLLFVYAKFHSQFAWTVYPTLSLLGGFALGFSGVMLVLHAAENSMVSKAKTRLHATAIPERLDVLAGAVAANMILGTTLVETDSFRDFAMPAGVVWLPAVLAWCGVCASFVTAKLLKRFTAGLPPSIGRMMNVFVMTIIAYVLVYGMLPGYWVIEGQEKLSSEIFLAAEVGIIGGFLLLETSNAYAWLRNHYYAWTFNKFDREVWYAKPFRHIFRIICLTVPVLLAAVFLVYTYQYVGLYGILVSAVAMLSNINARLSFAKNQEFPAVPHNNATHSKSIPAKRKPAFAMIGSGIYANAAVQVRNAATKPQDRRNYVPLQSAQYDWFGFFNQWRYLSTIFVPRRPDLSLNVNTFATGIFNHRVRDTDQRQAV